MVSNSQTAIGLDERETEHVYSLMPKLVFNVEQRENDDEYNKVIRKKYKFFKLFQPKSNHLKKNLKDISNN
jgi:hypothetical protein